MQKLGEAKCEYDKINDFRLDVSTKCLSCDNRYFKKKNCSACASNVWSPTKFIISDNAKVRVAMNLLYVIVFETKIKDKGVKLMFLPNSI